MPYMRCPRCGLTTYSAARWSTTDSCERCGHELPHPKPHEVSLRLPARLDPQGADGLSAAPGVRSHKANGLGAGSVLCPGCGGRTELPYDRGATERCPRCETQLMVFAKRLDVESTVRERLYGSVQRPS